MSDGFEPTNSASDTDTKYRFFPVVRRGYPPDEYYDSQSAKGNAKITTAGTLTVDFSVTASGNGTASGGDSVGIDMYGPEHVTGIDGRQIVRMEPEPGTTNFPPNYFATVEFDAPDLLWLFSPVAADSQDSANEQAKGRGLPWLCLVVVEKTEKTRVEPAGTKPLPSLDAPVPELPPLDEIWAWGHAQTVGSPAAKDGQSIEDAFRTGSTLTRSRLVSPRNLQPSTKYVAALVPVFEAGRLAGLGREVSTGETEMALAWPPSGTSVRNGDGGRVTLPVYHHWEFTTGRTGDFEYLARQLEPRNLNEDTYDIGFREVDATDPGPTELNLSGFPAENRTVRMGGALRQADSTAGEYAASDTLRDVLNTPEDVQELTDEDYEVVGPPTYGDRHAQVTTLTDPPATGDEWVADLNLHPGHRLAAAVGSGIVRDNQEQLMASAWDQVGEIRKANRVLAAAQLSRAAMETKLRVLDGAPSGWRAQFTAPAHDRVVLDPESNGSRTAGRHLEASWAPRGLTAAPFRRLLSGSGRLAGRLDGDHDAGTLLERVTNGELTVTSPGRGPEGVLPLREEVDLRERCASLRPEEPTTDPDDGLERSEVVETLRERLSRMEAHCDDVFDVLDDIEGVLKAADPGDDPPELGRLRRRLTDTWNEMATYLSQVHDTMLGVAYREKVDDLPTVDSDFTKPRARTLAQRLEAIIARTLLDDGEAEETDAPTHDDVQGARSDVFELLVVLDEIRSYLAVGGGSDEAYEAGLYCDPTPDSETATAVDPDIDRVGDAVRPIPALESRVGARLGGIDLGTRDDPLDRVMAYPEFPDPTFDDLREVSEDYLLPGASEIPRETFGALETNPQFIESFMVGLNHEMADELLWRGYPCDRRGSYFRQFWDPGARVPKPSDPDLLKDITEIHTWDDKGGASPLGSNVMTGADDGSNPGTTPEATSNVVVVIRGELLRRYPQTTIYATKAKEVAREDGSGTERVPEWPTAAETEAEVDDEYHRFPIFRGGLDPDVNFLGFDLETDVATGEEPSQSVDAPDAEDSLGWFFVMEEPPGEVRFGMDVDQGDVGDRPNGVTYATNGSTSVERTDAPNDDPEHGWSGLSWGHLVSDADDLSTKDNVSIYTDRPGAESWRTESGSQWVTDAKKDTVEDPTLDDEEAAVWGRNSADMAYITWQRPVRIAIHADDLLPDGNEGGGT